MISHVSVCLLAHEEKGLISNTFCHAKREYSFSVRPISCAPVWCYLQISSISSFEIAFTSGMPSNLACGVDKSGVSCIGLEYRSTLS